MSAVSVILARHYHQLAHFAIFQPMLAIQHHCVLANGHSVDERHGVHTHKRAHSGGVEHRALNVEAVGIGAVEHQQRHIVFGAGFHHVVQRRNISVEPHANILNIKYYKV